MRIRCDADAMMGYIYLMHVSRKEHSENMKKYIDKSNLEISVLEQNDIDKKLDKLKVSKKLYSQAVDVDFHEEFKNDLDKEGYLKGIELHISKEEFIEKIKNKSFRINLLNWKNKEFYMVTFDLQEEVFKKENILYPLTSKKDTFVIVDINSKWKTGFIRALVSSRKGVYSFENFVNAEFILYE